METFYNGDNVQRNKTTFRAELRELLAVKRPSAFVKVTLAARAAADQSTVDTAR